MSENNTPPVCTHCGLTVALGADDETWYHVGAFIRDSVWRHNYRSCPDGTTVATPEVTS